MTDHPILSVVEELKKARIAEEASAEVLATGKAELERIRAIALAEAYQTGQIDGKNAETRHVQEIQLLTQSETVKTAEATLRMAETKHAALRIDRQYQEELYHAHRALLNRPEAGS
jgi:hypothetical protein